MDRLRTSPRLHHVVNQTSILWQAIPPAKVNEFRDDDGLVNEFALLWNVRIQFPLHFTVFKQVSSHMAHEGNSEELFSQAGNLSSDNGRGDPDKLATWTYVSKNMFVFKPLVKDIMARYFKKYSRGGRLPEQDDPSLGLVQMNDVPVYNMEAGRYYARFGEHAAQ